MHWDDKLHFVFIMQFVCYAMVMLGRILLVFNIKCTMRQCWHYFVHFVIIFNNENIYRKILYCHCAPRQRVIALLCFVFSSLDCDMKVLTLERVRVWDDSGKIFCNFFTKNHCPFCHQLRSWSQLWSWCLPLQFDEISVISSCHRLILSSEPQQCSVRT